MRRIATAAVAATTALSLVAAPAMALTKEEKEYMEKEPTSSMQAYTLLSSQLSSGEDQARLLTLGWSSLQNDMKNGYAAGTTLDILLGTGIAAILLVAGGNYAVQQGLIKLPF